MVNGKDDGNYYNYSMYSAKSRLGDWSEREGRNHTPKQESFTETLKKQDVGHKKKDP